MKVHISGRGVAVSPALRRRVETKVIKVDRFLPKISETRVVLALERYRHMAEVTLQAKGAVLRAEAEANDFHAAVDLAVENLERQARRRKEKIRARKRRPVRGAVVLGLGPTLVPSEEPGPGGPEVIVRRLEAKPMSVDEALEQMRVRRDGFLVFTNARSRVVNVLRRRADGRLELLQPGGR